MIKLSELNKLYGIGIHRAKRLIKVGKLILHKDNTDDKEIYVTSKSLENFLIEQNNFNQTYIYFKDFLNEFPVLAAYRIHTYIDNYEKLNANFTSNLDFLKINTLEENYYGNNKQVLFFKKSDVELLRNEYVDLIEAKKLAGIAECSCMTKWLSKRPNIEIFSFGPVKHQRFIHKDLLNYAINYFDNIKAEKNKVKIKREISKAQARNILSLSENYFDAIVKSGLLSSLYKDDISGIIYFNKSDVLDLVELQKKEYAHLSKTYYSKNEIIEKYPNLIIDSINKLKRISKIVLPPLLTPLFISGEKKWEMPGKYLYSKKDIDKFNDDILLRNDIYNSGQNTDAFDEYKRRLTILRIEFDERHKITEKVWFNYVEEILKSSPDIQTYTSLNYINVLTNAAEGIKENIDKEIYNYTSNQLNILLLNNENIPRSAREHIYQYLIFLEKVVTLNLKVNNSLKRPYRIEKLINPRKLPRNSQEVKIYSYEEYQNLFNYAINVEIHKQESIYSIQDYLEGKTDTKTYTKYDSVWLYVLLHLNNAWRHSDCINIPRITLVGTEIKDLNWLLNNNISKEDAKKIIFRLKAADMIISKTGAERNFFCSEEVEVALATAIAICELRTRIVDDTAETIIYKLDSKGSLAKKPRSVFFKKFEDPAFSFQNRAMNRTLLSLMIYIQSITGNSSDSEYIRILRSHVDFETTNIYITIPQERIDTIALQLFDRDMFGHIPQVLSELVFGKSNDETTVTKNINLIKDSFGDLYKVEEMARFLNNIHIIKSQASQKFLTENKEYESIVENIIRTMSKEEVNSLFQRTLTSQLSSKEKGYQCLVSESDCKFPGRTCTVCPLAIPNFYALSALIEGIFKKIDVIEKSLNEDLPVAEKTRLANWIALDLDLLEDAQKKYGKQEITLFATGIMEKLKSINPIRSYQTIWRNLLES